MQAIVNFSGLSLTSIFQIQSIQSLLIKFWYLGLTSDCIVARQDVVSFRSIKKSINFATCFTFQMPIKTYVNFAERIMKALQKLQPRQIFDVLLGHLKNNKITTISFQLFGVAFLQLFGKTLQLMNSLLMNKILRQIYIQLTIIGKSGSAMMKADKSQVKQIDMEKFIPHFKQYLNQQVSEQKKPFLNPEQNSQEINHVRSASHHHKDLKTLQGRLQSQAQLNNSLKDVQPGQYPTGEKMKNKDKTNISCFMMGGFEIVDYSQSINQLHRKLLTKILLNK